MDEELKQLEAELGRLRPLAPTHALRTAIAREIDQSVSSRRAFPRRLWLGIALPIAAAISGALIYLVPRTSETNPAQPTAPGQKTGIATASPAPEFKPVSARNILVRATDEGVVSLADGTPARRIRESYVDTITWRNSATKASLTWTLPREEVKVVPVSYQ